MATAKELQELEEASNKSADVAASALDESLKTVMSHLARIDRLKPKTADEATYQKLVPVLQEATRKNESVAALRANVQKLGAGAIVMLNDMAKLARNLV